MGKGRFALKTAIALLIAFIAISFAFDIAVNATQQEQRSWTDWSQKEVGKNAQQLTLGTNTKGR